MALSGALRSTAAFRISHATGFSLPAELLLVALTLLLLFVMVYPTLWIMVASFRTPATIFTPGAIDFTLANYRDLFASGFARFIFNSLYLCVLAVLLSTFVSLLAA
jgi:ABC-type glycerol-3-phosphate transport system permease component